MRRAPWMGNTNISVQGTPWSALIGEEVRP